MISPARRISISPNSSKIVISRFRTRRKIYKKTPSTQILLREGYAPSGEQVRGAFFVCVSLLRFQQDNTKPSRNVLDRGILVRMSIIVSVKINDGIVMAADSTSTFYSDDGRPGQIYENADKIVNLVKGLPIGVMTCGAGGVGRASVATLLKDLRVRLSGQDVQFHGWKLDRSNYTMEAVAGRVRDFFEERAIEAEFMNWLMFRVCGYSFGRPLPEIWQVLLQPEKPVESTCIQREENLGPQWNGENEALDRLMFGLGSNFVQATMKLGLTQEQANDALQKLVPELGEYLIMQAAPIQDAIDQARFMVNTTKGFIRFAIKRAKTVGGPIEVAAITKHEGRAARLVSCHRNK
jgi:hypothetical protein